MVMSCVVLSAQQVDSMDFGDELDDIFNMEVSVASKNSVSINETPGVVTVVTKEEIQNSGARNLIDVLNLVPVLISEWMLQTQLVPVFVGFGLMKENYWL
jgi:outer membrane receptor for ferrienterochelin and colicin